MHAGVQDLVQVVSVGARPGAGGASVADTQRKHREGSPSVPSHHSPEPGCVTVAGPGASAMCAPISVVPFCLPPVSSAVPCHVLARCQCPSLTHHPDGACPSWPPLLPRLPAGREGRLRRDGFAGWKCLGGQQAQRQCWHWDSCAWRAWEQTGMETGRFLTAKQQGLAALISSWWQWCGEVSPLLHP